MLELTAFAAATRQALSSDADEAARVRTVRSTLTSMLAREDFTLDCVEAVTAQIEAAPLGAWRNAAIHQDAECDFAVRMIYWPAQYENNPHRHTTWTVTGVVHNRLSVATYRWDGEEHTGRLVVEKSIDCGEGQVGYILPPCIHTVKNPTESTSVSIHLFSGVVGEGPAQPAQGTVWYPSARKGEVVRGATSRALRAHCALLGRLRTPRATELLDRTFALGDRRVKLASVKAMSRTAPTLAGTRLAELAQQSEAPAREQLERLSARLIASGA